MNIKYKPVICPEIFIHLSKILIKYGINLTLHLYHFHMKSALLLCVCVWGGRGFRSSLQTLLKRCIQQNPIRHFSHEVIKLKMSITYS